jgi:hypothetical protein
MLSAQRQTGQQLGRIKSCKGDIKPITYDEISGEFMMKRQKYIPPPQ